MKRDDVIGLLNDVSPEANWTYIINEINRNYYKKNEKPQRFWEINKDFRRKFYSQIIPDHLEVMRKINEYMNKKRDEIDVVNPEVYDYGIYLIGFSEDPIILSLGFMRPRNIYFIYSEESEEMLELLIEGFSYFDEEMRERVEKALQKGYKTKLRNSSDPAETFKTIKNVVQNIRSNGQDKKIMVDITGGKKTMVSGAFSSTSLLKDVDIIYVDFGSYNDIKRKPEYCTEFISKLQNPNNIYRYTDLERIKGLFNSHRYDVVSEDIAKQLEVMDKYSTDYYDEENVKLRELKKWADIYNNWDQYRYSVFSVHSNSEDIKKLHGLNDQDKLLLEQVAKEFDLGKANNPSSILQKKFENTINGKPDIEYYDRIFSFVAVDRYCNAKRRIETDNEGCIIRLCSIIELLTYYYLIRNHDNLEITIKGKNGRESMRKEEFVRIIFGNYPDNLRNENHGVLRSVQARVNLIGNKKPNKEYGKKYKFKWKVEWMNKLDKNEMSWLIYLDDIIKKRNKSSITHSIGSNEDEKVKEYLGAVRDFIKWVFSFEEKVFDDLESKIRFRKEGEITGF